MLFIYRMVMNRMINCTVKFAIFIELFLYIARFRVEPKSLFHFDRSDMDEIA